MNPVKLFTRDGGYVVTVLIPPFLVPADAIQWGSRVFFLQPNGEYREGLLFFAVHEVPEPPTTQGA